MSVPPELMDSMQGDYLPPPVGVMQPPATPSPSLAAQRRPPPKPGPRLATKPAAAQPAAEPTATEAASKMGAKGEQYLAEDIETYRSDANASRQAAQQYGRDLESLSPSAPQVFKEAAPQYADFAKQVSPFLMIATVLGGKAMKISGQGMMGALTGMVEGTAEGNAERYNAAYKEYQDHYKRFKEEEADRVAYRDELLKWHKGKLDAAQIAAQESLRVVGVDEKMIQTGVNGDVARARAVAAVDKLNLDAAKYHAQLANDQAKAGRLQYQAMQKEMGKVEGVEAASEKFSDAVDNVEVAYSKLMQAAKSDSALATAINTNAIFNSDAAASALRVKYPVIAELEQAYASLVGPSIREFNEGVTAAAQRNVRVENAEIMALPDIRKGLNSVTAAVNGLRKKANLAKQRASELRTTALRNYQSGSGSPLYSQQELDAARSGSPAPSAAPQGRAPLSEQDQQALDWAREHKGDPRAKQILQMHGEQ